MNYIRVNVEAGLCINLVRVLTTGPQGGVSRIVHWTEGPKVESGGGVLGEGQQPPPHQLGGLGRAVSSPSGVWGGAATAQRFSTIFSTQDDLSCHYNIVNCGLSCRHWGQDPRAPLRTLLHERN